MPATPSEIDEIVEKLLPLLVRWHEKDTLGEIAILRGGQEWEVEERPKRSVGKVKRARRREGYVEKVGQV